MVLIHQTLALCSVVKLLRFMQCCKAIMVCFSIKIKKIFVFGNLTQNVGSFMGIRRIFWQDHYYYFCNFSHKRYGKSPPALEVAFCLFKEWCVIQFVR